MGYNKATWLNRHAQFGTVSLELLLTDDTGKLPPHRVQKQYKMTDAQVNAAFLATEAAKEKVEAAKHHIRMAGHYELENLKINESRKLFGKTIAARIKNIQDKTASDIDQQR